MTTSGFEICAIFRDEAPYLKEWIDFHLREGAQHFYLYDNLSTDKPEQVLQEYIQQNLVTLTHWPMSFLERGQEKAYDDCIRRSKSSDRWIAFIDIDEFLFSPLSRVEIVLDQMTHYPAVTVNTVCYGTNGHSRYVDSPVIERFTRRAPLWWKRNLQRKVILRPKATQHAITPHRFEYVNGGRAVNPNGIPEEKDKGVLSRSLYMLSNKIIQSSFLMRVLPNWVALLLDPYGGLKPRYGGVGLLRINHYVLRSKEEYAEKQRRFRSSQYETKYDDPYLWYHDQNQVYDPILVVRARRFGA